MFTFEQYVYCILVAGAIVYLYPSKRRRKRNKKAAKVNKLRDRLQTKKTITRPDKKLKMHAITLSDAKLAIRRFDALTCPAQRFGFLRSINHFTFEELILSAYERKGYKVIRNEKYTGDGGIDGKVVIDGSTVLIQAKRYSGAISRIDVSQFGHICISEKTTGLFIHTGTTPKSVWKEVNQLHPQIEIISGERLLKTLEL